MRSLPLLASAVLVLIGIACGSSSDDGGTDPLVTHPADGGTSGGSGNGSSGTSGGGTSSGGTDLTPDPDGPQIPYDKVTLKTIHNAYQRDEPLLDQMLYDNVRSLEVDIHKGKGDDAPSGQWWVYHIDAPTQDGSSCKFFDDCLAAMAAFHKAMPNHEVVTLYVDFKDDWVTGHMPEDLDTHIAKVLGRENIAAPGDFIKACNGATTLRDAVAAPCGFPSLGALRGKFILAGTGGSACDANSHVSKYGNGKSNDRLVFLSADLNKDCTLEQYDAHKDVVFFNMSMDDKGRAQAVRDKGLIARIYKGGLNGGLDSAEDFNAAKAAGAQQLATDKVNVVEDPWSSTTAKLGFPFSCVGCDDLTEKSPLLAVSATSGDQEGKADSAFYAYMNDQGESTWTAAVGVPSSHVEEFAKGCLVARATEDPASPHVSFCRPFDNHPPRTQIRLTQGDSTIVEEAPAWANFSSETAFFLRLHVRPDGDDTQVETLVSKDGKDFQTLSQRIVHASLPLRGVSVSSHGAGKLHAFFAGLTRTVTDLPNETITASKLTKKPIGAGASGDVKDGPFAP